MANNHAAPWLPWVVVSTSMSRVWCVQAWGGRSAWRDAVRTHPTRAQNTGIVIPPYLFSFFSLLVVLLLGCSFTALLFHVRIALSVDEVTPATVDGQVFVAEVFQITEDKLLFVRRRPCALACAALDTCVSSVSPLFRPTDAVHWRRSAVGGADALELPANFPLAVYLHFGHPGHGACCEVLDLRRASVLQSIAPQLRKLGSFFVVLIVVIFAFASYECAWRDTRCVLQPPLTFVNIRSWPLVVPDVSFGFNFIETRTLMTSMMEQTTASLVGTRWEPRVLLSGVVRLAHAATVPRVAHSASPISTVCKELHRSWDPCLSSFSRSS